MSKLTECIGWLGGVMLALCGAPEAYTALTTGETGLGYPFLLTWLIGEILAFTYTLIKSKEVKLAPLIWNYGLNILFISLILGVKVGLL